MTHNQHRLSDIGTGGQACTAYTVFVQVRSSEKLIVVSSMAPSSVTLLYALESERVSENSKTKLRSTARRSSMKRVINIEEILLQSSEINQDFSTVQRRYRRSGEGSSVVCVDLKRTMSVNRRYGRTYRGTSAHCLRAESSLNYYLHHIQY